MIPTNVGDRDYHARLEARIKLIVKPLAEQTGLAEVSDYYFFLARVGSNYHDYPFNWEPFRDLAGPLKVGKQSIPIVVMSDDNDRTEPEVKKGTVPEPHFQMRVSPSIDVVRIADRWLELLVDDGALHAFAGSKDWFLDNLRINAKQLSRKARAFLQA